LIRAKRSAIRWSMSSDEASRTKQRIAYLTERLAAEREELTELERDAVRKAALHETIASRVDQQMQRNATRGQRVADSVARVGGSWRFVITFCAFLVVWMIANTWMMGREAFDRYPFILLNLVLSCVAALQAPIIMMSQNRAQARDRAHADEDYRVNLKAELEILGLHEKLDHLLHTRWESLIEMQECQLDMLRDLVDKVAAKPDSSDENTKPPVPARS
jgi:uncharacterized membrane protein